MPSLTRRSFVASAAALPFAMRSLAQPAAAPKWVLLGTDKGAGIFRCAWNAASGTLGQPELAVKAERPDFLAMHPRLPRLYAVNSLGDGKGAISSFFVDRGTGALTFGESQPSLGDGPCFVSVDPLFGQLALVANYSGGSFTALRLKQGVLQPPSGHLDCRGNVACGTQGPVKGRQDASHLHCAVFSPDGYFALACDLGNDSIEVFQTHPEVIGLRPTAPLERSVRFDARPGSGPRHLAFSRTGKWVYVIHELDCTVELFDWDSPGIGKASLKRREGSAVSTLAAGAKRDGATACEIVVSDDGRFVYTCTRGTNTLDTFRVDQKTGHLTEHQRLSCGGEIPRHIAFDPSERWLLCANQAGSSVTVFAHDAANGKITGPMQTVAADTPMFVQFV